MATYFHNGLAGSPTNAWAENIGPTYTSATSTFIVYGHGSGFETRLTGTFTVNGAGVVTAGTITGMQRTNVDGSIVYEAITNIGNVPVMNFINQAQSSNKMASVMTGADTLNGHSGQDFLRGFGGVDTFNGGGGNDLYVIEDAGEVINEAADGGDNDAVDTTLNSYTLGANLEHLTFFGAGAFSGTGNAANNIIKGGTSGDVLSGGDGHDELIGGVGADNMDGGADNDTYHVDNLLDSITDASGADRVYAFISGVTLAAGIEGYGYYGSGGAVATGNALDNTFDGGAGNDEFFGLAGEDSFHAGPNTGADIFHGGADSDKYYVNSSDDVVDEAMGGGDADTVYAVTSTYTLTANVEQLYHVAAGENFVGTGNIGDNYISAGGGDDQLFGLDGKDKLFGNFGDDILFGGDGDDEIYGDADDDTVSGGLGADALDGGAGTDTVDYADSLAGVKVGLAGNTISGGDAEGDSLLGFENITGSDHDDELIGSAGVNILVGGFGNDYLEGGGGLDTLNGGGGDDEYYLAGGSATIIDTDGDDTIITTVSRSLVDHLTIENLMLSAIGDLNLTGNGLDNTLTANTDDNILAGGAGADILIGSLGDDTYILTDKLDTINDAGGVDRIESSVTLNLGDYSGVENLTLVGGDLNAAGSTGDNLIVGTAGKNFLIGGGGKDTLRGMAGDDTYGIDSADDMVDEFIAGSGGNDLVKSLVSFSLANASTAKGAIETLELLGSATEGTGNDIANTLIGNALINSLYGGLGNDHLIGGLGADTLRGGKGNDTYEVDNGLDVIDETFGAGDGIDTVSSSVSFSLANVAVAKGDIETLKLIGSATSGTGNDIANTLIGNGLANTLYGGLGSDFLIGGLGTDTLRGGKGSDTYVVDTPYDVVDETYGLGDGIDTVFASTSFSLANSTRLKGAVEHLTLTGASNSNAVGNALANALTGNGGNNTLTGAAGNDTLRGGLGNDIMRGGLGNDTYSVNSAFDLVHDLIASSGGNDRVTSSISANLSNAARFKGLIEGLVFSGAADLNGTGNKANNSIIGNTGDNWLRGMGGNDRLTGGLGTDKLTGGTGNDRFAFKTAADSRLAGSDRIFDFDDSGNDVIDLSVLTSGKLSFIGGDAFTGLNQVRIKDVAGPDVVVQINLAGSTAADMAIRLTATSAAAMTADDFIL